ncbi:unnamed protein product [Mytilus coruscus]|uniref:Uncharacterized protein n=1 Tax=Mytilus coruscus TaxID=42192 RepID=A0A6J7ZTF3_MYTCO|nr:unnamed protein product [Mytilus coruscus]
MHAFPDGYKWTKSSTSKFQDALCHPVYKTLLNNFMNHDYDNEDSERAVSDFLNFINVAASKANIFRNKSSEKRRPNCKWFDSYLGVKRKTLVSKVCNQLFEPENTFLFCDNDTVTDTINCTLSCYPGFAFDHDPKDFYLCGPDTLHQWDIQTVENPLARLPSCTGEHISAYISMNI